MEWGRLLGARRLATELQAIRLADAAGSIAPTSPPWTGQVRKGVLPVIVLRSVEGGFHRLGRQSERDIAGA